VVVPFGTELKLLDSYCKRLSP